MKVVPDTTAARARIRATQDAYRAAVETGTIDALVATFTRDGMLELAGRRYVGRIAIRGAFAHARRRPHRAGELPRPRTVRHVLGESEVEFRSPTEAVASTRFRVETPAGTDHAGRYVDRFVLVDGAWLLARRRILIEWAASGTALGARSRIKAVQTAAQAAAQAAARRPTVAGAASRRQAG